MTWSDSSWRFACGDVFFFREAQLWEPPPSISVIIIIVIFIVVKVAILVVNSILIISSTSITILSINRKIIFLQIYYSNFHLTIIKPNYHHNVTRCKYKLFHDFRCWPTYHTWPSLYHPVSISWFTGSSNIIFLLQKILFKKWNFLLAALWAKHFDGSSSDFWSGSNIETFLVSWKLFETFKCSYHFQPFYIFLLDLKIRVQFHFRAWRKR